VGCIVSLTTPTRSSLSASGLRSIYSPVSEGNVPPTRNRLWRPSNNKDTQFGGCTHYPLLATLVTLYGRGSDGRHQPY
jgi:hypothetical protein